MTIERRFAATLGAFVSLVLAGALVPTMAGAAVSCSFTAATATATVTLAASADAATVGRSGAAIQVNGANCGTATVNNTDKIAVVGTVDHFQRLAVDRAGGVLGPGKTAETGAGVISEIEITVDLRSGTGEEVAIVGGSAADTAVFGTAGARLNTDADVDLTFSGLDQVELDGNAGADTLSVGGGGAAGSPLARSSDIDGGADTDTLTGGRGVDTLVGGPDGSTPTVLGDTLRGGPAGDTLRGGDGRDAIFGDAGVDYLEGDAGDDDLNGGPDGDQFGYYAGSLPDGADDISGGPDTDLLWLTARTANVIVKLDNVANDGADVGGDGTAEEADNVRSDVENVQTGAGKDLVDARFPCGASAGPFVRRQQRRRFAARRRSRRRPLRRCGARHARGRRRGRLSGRRRGVDSLEGGDGEDQLYPATTTTRPTPVTAPTTSTAVLRPRERMCSWAEPATTACTSAAAART